MVHNEYSYYNKSTSLGTLAFINCRLQVLYVESLTIHNNYERRDRNDNWSQLGFLKAFYIENLKPIINEGLKAARELDL